MFIDPQKILVQQFFRITFATAMKQIKKHTKCTKKIFSNGEAA